MHRQVASKYGLICIEGEKHRLFRKSAVVLALRRAMRILHTKLVTIPKTKQYSSAQLIQQLFKQQRLSRTVKYINYAQMRAF